MDHKDILLSPIKIGTRTSVNRFFIQPMECTDADTEGIPRTSPISAMKTCSKARPVWWPWKRSLLPIRIARA